MVKNCDLSLKKYFFQDLGHSFSPYEPPSRQITYMYFTGEENYILKYQLLFHQLRDY